MLRNSPSLAPNHPKKEEPEAPGKGVSQALRVGGWGSPRKAVSLLLPRGRLTGTPSSLPLELRPKAGNGHLDPEGHPVGALSRGGAGSAGGILNEGQAEGERPFSTEAGRTGREGLG